MTDTTEAPKRGRKKAPEPAKAITARSQRLRAERAAQGLAEVRGIWARPEHHEAIKEFARSLA